MNKRKLGKYEIIERLGRGGMAEVFRAYHPNLDRFVAIKVLHDFLADDVEFKSRFEEEARNIARLRHAHIVQVYDFEYDRETASYYMVMEFVDGVTLRDALMELRETGKALPLSEVLRITREAASALAYAHRNGMIHRDVKPGNLMLDRDDDNRVVLTDFGIAKLLSSGQPTMTGNLVGTPAYMSPEQGIGDSGDERSDLYSLGVILYQMLTGQLPYDADTPLALILRHMNDPIPSACAIKPRLPRRVDHLIANMMAKEAEDRYQTADEIINDIVRLEADLRKGVKVYHQTSVDEGDTEIGLDVPTLQDFPTQPLLPVRRPDTGSTRRWWLVGALGVFVLVFVLVGGYVLGARNGVFPAVALLASHTPTSTATPTATVAPVQPTETAVMVAVAASTSTPTLTLTATLTATSTSTSTPTHTDTPTRTPTLTSTPTPTRELTPTPTPNVTQTLALVRTATFAACEFDYAVVEQTPEDGEDGGYFEVNTDYERTITLLNTGTCAWEQHTSLVFISGSGEDFDAGPRVFIREPVEVGEEVNLVFQGTTPASGRLENGNVVPVSGSWQLRTRGQIPIGEPMMISILVYDPGDG